MAVTWGLDVSTNKAGTDAVAVDWSAEGTARSSTSSTPSWAAT